MSEEGGAGGCGYDFKAQCKEMKSVGIKSRRGRGILLAAILASGMSFLAGTTVFIATPAIQEQFSAGFAQIQWMLNAYVLTLAVLILVAGSLGDHFGRKRVFNIGIGVFIIGSIISGLAQSINQLIFFQVIQGIGAAMMIPGSLAIINASFSEDERGQAIGYWSGLAGGVAALGPFIGGWLVQTYGWRSIFFLNAPIGILALLATLAFVYESKDPQARHIDWLGIIVIAVGLFGMSFGLIQGPVTGWASFPVLLGLIGGNVFLVGFVLIEMKVRKPLVPLFLFKNPLVSGANLITIFLYTALQGLIFFLILNLQQVQGFTPIQAGLALLPPILLITFLSGPGGKLADRIGPRIPLIVGPLIVALGIALLIIPGTEAVYARHIVPALVLFGTGMALVVAPLTKSALSVVQEHSGVASGINNGVSRIAALLAIALFGAIMASVFTGQLTAGLDQLELSIVEKNEILVQANQLGNIDIPETWDDTLQQSVQAIVHRSFIHGFRWIMAISAMLAVLSAICAYILIRVPERTTKEHGQA